MKAIRRMRFMAVAILLLAAALAGCSPGGALAESQPATDTITVTGVGRTVGDPDMARVQVGVSVSNEDVGTAVERSNQVITDLLDLLAEQGIAEQDIQTTNFSIWSEDQWDPETGQPREQKLYRVESTLQLTVREVDDLGPILETAIENGANNIYGLSFTIADPTSLADEARAASLRDARERAEVIASELGLSLGRVLSVTEVSGAEVVPVAEAARGMGGGGGEPPISEGSMSVSVATEVVYELVD